MVTPETMKLTLSFEKYKWYPQSLIDSIISEKKLLKPAVKLVVPFLPRFTTFLALHWLKNRVTLLAYTIKISINTKFG